MVANPLVCYKLAMNHKPIIPQPLAGYYTDWHFSPAVKTNGILLCSGFTGVAPDGTLSIEPETQFVQAFETVKLVLAEAKMDFRNVVEMTSYHVGLQKHLDLFRRVRDQYVVEPYPAWTAIGVSELAVENALVEIRISASQSMGAMTEGK